MSDESKKDLVIGMLLGLINTLDGTFTAGQQESYDQAKNIINELYYSKTKTEDLDTRAVESYQKAELCYMRNAQVFIDTANKKYSDILSKNLDELVWDNKGRSNRILRCLHAEGITTVGDVYKHTRYFFLKIPNFGRKCVDDLMAMF